MWWAFSKTNLCTHLRGAFGPPFQNEWLGFQGCNILSSLQVEKEKRGRGDVLALLRGQHHLIYICELLPRPAPQSCSLALVFFLTSTAMVWKAALSLSRLSLWPGALAAHMPRGCSTVTGRRHSSQLLLAWIDLDVWNLHKIPISASINKALWEHSHAHLTIYYLWRLSHYRRVE